MQKTNMVKLFPVTMIRDWKVETYKTAMAAVLDIIRGFVLAYSLKKANVFVVVVYFFSVQSAKSTRSRTDCIPGSFQCVQVLCGTLEAE